MGGPGSLRGAGFFMSRIAFLIDGFNLYHALDYTDRDHPAADHYR